MALRPVAPLDFHLRMREPKQGLWASLTVAVCHLMSASDPVQRACICITALLEMVFPSGSVGKESACQCRRHRFDPWVGRIPWRRKWQTNPASLSGESQAQRSPADYSPWGQRVKHGLATKHAFTLVEMPFLYRLVKSFQPFYKAGFKILTVDKKTEAHRVLWLAWDYIGGWLEAGLN